MNLSKMNDTDFRSVVEADIKNRATEEQSEALRKPEVVTRWWHCLNSIIKSVEGALAAREADLQAQKYNLLRNEGKNAWLTRAEQAKRQRAASLRFYTAAQERLIEAKALYEQLHPREAYLQEERNRYAAAYICLRDAIREHRERRVMPEEFDEQLWAALNETEERFG